MGAPQHTELRLGLRAADCDLDDFRHIVEQDVDLADYPHADAVVEGVVVYSGDAMRRSAATPDASDAVAAELVHALADGPGIAVVAGAYADLDVVDRVTVVFEAIIADERAADGAHGDHFAPPGANDRVWNALEKLAVRDPGAFVDYYANDVIALVSTAWLGPGYQVTSQVNVVRPGGQAQEPHRDYHLGFLGNEAIERYPTHVHRLSPVLTLQGAIAHCDMPVESGPTVYVPHSHKYLPGYLAWRLPEFRAYVADHHVQLPLAKGDAVFFNPALFHGAGSNVSADVPRIASLLQVSSPFGRAMETVDRARVAAAVYPALRDRNAAGVPERQLRNAVAAAADGYPFPTNLDLDQPVDGLAPPAQTELLAAALAGDWTDEQVGEALAAYAQRRTTR